MEKTRVGIIGCGRIGTKRAAVLAPHHELTAFDQNPHSARQLLQSLPPQGDHLLASSIHAMIQDPTIKWMNVATFHRDLFEISRRCLEAGKPVLIEKPGAMSSEQLVQLSKVAAKAKLPVALGYNHRHHGAIRAAVEHVRAGTLGHVFMIRARYGHGARLGYEQEWRMNPELSGGGELIDQGTHLIDLAQWILGEPEVVTGHLSRYFWNAPVEDNAFISMKFRGGTTPATAPTAWLHASCTEWKNLFCMEIYGPRAKIQVDGLGGSYGTEKLTIYRMKPEMGPPQVETTDYLVDDSWEFEMREFERWMKNPAEGPGPLATLESGIQTLKSVEALTNSNPATKSARGQRENRKEKQE